MSDPSAGEIGGIIAGVVALLIAVGHGLRWALGWTDRQAAARSAKLDERERVIDKREDEYRETIEGQLKAIVGWAAKLQDEHRALRNAYQLIASALQVKDPKSPALAMAEELLKVAIPLEPEVPAEIAHLLTRIPDSPNGGKDARRAQS